MDHNSLVWVCALLSGPHTVYATITYVSIWDCLVFSSLIFHILFSVVLKLWNNWQKKLTDNLRFLFKLKFWIIDNYCFEQEHFFKKPTRIWNFVFQNSKHFNCFWKSTGNAGHCSYYRIYTIIIIDTSITFRLFCPNMLVYSKDRYELFI